jgi:hypothetical protein
MSNGVPFSCAERDGASDRRFPVPPSFGLAAASDQRAAISPKAARISRRFPARSQAAALPSRLRTQNRLGR